MTQMQARAPALPDAAVTTTPDDDGLGWPGLLTLMIGVFLPITDFFIVNVALPTIDRDLHASAGMLQLVVAGYAVSYALLLVVGGRIGDAVGRRRLFMLGMAGFTVTSLACGVAPTAALLVGARVLQGASAAMMLPQVLSTIQATTEGDRRAKALGLYGATGGLGTVAGQVLGGVLVSANIAGSGWRPVFLLNVPVGLIGMVLAARFVPDSTSSASAPVDLAGTSLLGLTLLSLLVPLTEGRSLGWPLWTIVLLALSPVAAFGFVVAERRLERRGGVPLVPTSVLALSSVRRGLLVGVPFFAGFGGFMFVYALVLQDGARFTPLRTGLTLVPMAVGFLAASLAMPNLIARFGRRVLVAGALIQLLGLAGLGAALLGEWPRPSPWSLLAGALGAGVGQGLVMTPLFRIVLSDVPAELAGVGSGVLVTMQQTSLALGVATFGSVYLSLSPATSFGALHAGLVVIAALLLTAVVVAVSSRRLPN